jgi:hypothetical protein
MKKYVVLTTVAGVLLLLLLLRHGTVPTTPGDSESPTQTNGQSIPSHPKGTDPTSEPNPPGVLSNNAVNGDVDQLERAVREHNQPSNNPVAFYGMVVDQDTNPLQNVTLDLEVSESYFNRKFEVSESSTNFQRETGPDGRFEVIGLTGHMVTVKNLSKEGYEPEVVQNHYGQYGARSGSFTDPVIFRMWSTSIPHEKLVVGDNWSPIIPDGRRYGVNLTNGSIAEGAEGDLVVWIKRPAQVDWHKYDWSCELTAKGGAGLLEENKDQNMLVAPASGYTNVFDFRQEAASSDWTHGLYRKRFYIQLRNGQIYGRITVNLASSPNRQNQAEMRVEYTFNPSGSRLLR